LIANSSYNCMYAFYFPGCGAMRIETLTAVPVPVAAVVEMPSVDVVVAAVVVNVVDVVDVDADWLAVAVVMDGRVM